MSYVVCDLFVSPLGIAALGATPWPVVVVKPGSAQMAIFIIFWPSWSVINELCHSHEPEPLAHENLFKQIPSVS